MKTKRLRQYIAALTVASTMVFSPALPAAEMNLNLPNGEFFLNPVSAPQLEKEGLFTPLEQGAAGQVVGFVSQGNFEQALEQLRTTHGLALNSLEAGFVYSPNGTANFNNASAAMFFLIGHVYFQLEMYEPAEAAFQSALATIPDYTRVLESLGYVYLMTDRYDEAREQLAKVASQGLVTANLYNALGFLNQESNNYWGAVASYQQAMMLDPNNEQLVTGLLYALSQTAQYDSALTLIEQMLQEKPDDAELWTFRAFMSQQSGNEAKALYSLETAIRLGDNDLSSLQSAANMHMQMGSVERAVELMRSAAIEDMDFQYYDQALNWFSRNDEWDALEELLDDVPYSTSDLSSEQRSRLLTRQASLDLHNGNDDSALDKLEDAVDLNGANAEALFELASIYRGRNNYNQADLLYQRATVDGTYRENAVISRASLAIDQGNYAQAREMLSEVVEANPSRVDIQRTIDQLDNLLLITE